MPPVTKNLFGLRVEIVSVKFLRVVVVIPTSKTVNWILWLVLNVPQCLGRGHVQLDVVETGELSHVVDDLDVKVRVVAADVENVAPPEGPGRGSNRGSSVAEWRRRVSGLRNRWHRG